MHPWFTKSSTNTCTLWNSKNTSLIMKHYGMRSNTPPIWRSDVTFARSHVFGTWRSRVHQSGGRKDLHFQPENTVTMKSLCQLTMIVGYILCAVDKVLSRFKNRHQIWRNMWQHDRHESLLSFFLWSRAPTKARGPQFWSL